MSKMNDLIRRSDARALLEFFNETDPLGHTQVQLIMNLPSTPRWIPLKEKEPEEEGEYLVSFDDGFIATTGYYDGDFELWADAGEPLAWMSLPAPYREG